VEVPSISAAVDGAGDQCPLTTQLPVTRATLQIITEGEAQIRQGLPLADPHIIQVPVIAVRRAGLRGAETNTDRLSGIRLQRDALQYPIRPISDRGVRHDRLPTQAVI